MILRVEADNYEAFQLRTWGASKKAPGALWLNADAPLESCFRALVVQTFFVAIVVDDHHLRRIGWKCPVCPGSALEGAWTYYSLTGFANRSASNSRSNLD
jgi:hypothetical protein